MRLRAPVAADAPGVLDVLVARDLVDRGEPDSALGNVEDEWRASDLDLATDARVVEADGQIVAYALVRPYGTFAVVAPEFERRGIGTRLLHWAEYRERQQGRTVHRQSVASTNERGRSLLVDAGYTLVRSYWRMSRELERTASEPVLPEGVTLRPLDVARDAVSVYAVDDAAFSATRDYRPVSLQTFREAHLENHDFVPELSSVVEVDGEMAGFLLTCRWPGHPVGFIDVLGVAPDQQGRGIGTMMLTAAFARFAAAGIEQAELGVASDNPGARRLYERLGMRPKFQADTYERPIRAGGQPTDR
jgi:mycothiol synthase